jgi:hypothetical protein
VLAISIGLRGQEPAKPDSVQKAIQKAQSAPVKEDIVKKPVAPKKDQWDVKANRAPARILYLQEGVQGYREPGGEGSRFVPSVWYGGKSYLPIMATRNIGDATWHQVLTQDRPNSTRVWIKEDSEMKLYRGRHVIDLDLRTQTLRWYKDRRMMLKTRAAIGKSSTPTPKGEFFVTHLSRTPSREYGPFMLVTSAHSEVLRSYGGIDDAIVAIHGPITSEAQFAQGARLSSGCVRLKLRDLELLRDVPPGTLFIVH